MTIERLQPLDVNLVVLPKGEDDHSIDLLRGVIEKGDALFGITPVCGRGGGI